VRVLAVDVGDKRLGLAMSDPLGLTAQPLDVWERRTLPEDIRHLAAVVQRHDVRTIVVGHPVTLGGRVSPQTAKAEAFAQALRSACACPVRLWDERLTTAQGERVLKEGRVRRQQRRIIVNQVAAQLLLQHYLETQRQ